MEFPKLVVQAQEHLEPSEEVLAFVPGTYETKRFGQDSVRSGVLLATDRRVVFYAKKMTGYELESFPYENISSFEQGKNFMGATLRFFASGNEVHLKWIKGDVAPLASAVKQRMKGGTPSPPVQQPQQQEPDVADQIRKLAELRDAGILTEEEFTAKKRQLLEI